MSCTVLVDAAVTLRTSPASRNARGASSCPEADEPALEGTPRTESCSLLTGRDTTTGFFGERARPPPAIPTMFDHDRLRGRGPAHVDCALLRDSAYSADVRELNRLAWGVVGLRILMGVLWLANLSWKLPPDFGRDQPRGLMYSFRQAEQYAIGEPLRWFVRHIVIPHFSLFGWQVFLVEAVAGALLLLGWHTRIGAVVGLLQSIAIAALTMRAPNQWFWGFALFVAVSLVLVVVPANLRLSLDRRQGRV